MADRQGFEGKGKGAYSSLFSTPVMGRSWPNASPRGSVPTPWWDGLDPTDPTSLPGGGRRGVRGWCRMLRLGFKSEVRGGWLADLSSAWSTPVMGRSWPSASPGGSMAPPRWDDPTDPTDLPGGGRRGVRGWCRMLRSRARGTKRQLKAASPATRITRNSTLLFCLQTRQRCQLSHNDQCTASSGPVSKSKPQIQSQGNKEAVEGCQPCHENHQEQHPAVLPANANPGSALSCRQD